MTSAIRTRAAQLASLLRGLAERLVLVAVVTVMLGGLYLYHQAAAAEPRPTLRDAAELGLIPMLERLTPAQANAPLEYGDTPLCVAARFGRVSAIKALLSCGADVNGVAFMGTPLMEAARHGHAVVVRLLLEHGADVHLRTPDGNDALLDAVRAQATECVAVLLLAGADPARPGMRDNPLSLITEEHELSLAELLLAAGADPTLAGADGHRPDYRERFSRNGAALLPDVAPRFRFPVSFRPRL